METREKAPKRHIIYKVTLSLSLGFLSFLGTFHTTALPWGDVKLLFSWSLILVLLVSIAWGFPFALLSYIGGLTFLYPFYVGSYNGWGSVLTSLVYLLYISMHGIAASKRRKQSTPKWYLNPWSVHFFYIPLRLFLYFAIYPTLIEANPPFWTEDVLGSISTQTIFLYSVRGILMETLFLGLVRTLLLLPWVRKAFLMKLSPSTKSASHIIYAMTALGVFFSTLIQILHHRILGNEPQYSFLLNPSNERIVLTVFTVGILAIIGGYAASYVDHILHTQYRLEENEEYVRKVLSRLHHLNTELEEKVEKRSEELAFLGEELEAYAHTISHDLRTPLRAISGYCSMIEEYMPHDLDPASKDDLGAIEGITRKTRGFIEALLSYSLLSQQPLEKTEVNMQELFQETFAPFSSLPVCIIPSDEEALVFGDRALLKSALEELLRSGILFWPIAGTPLSIETSSIPGGMAFLLPVQSTPSQANTAEPHIQMFSTPQGEQSSDSGLGLATVKKIIELHEGRLFFRSGFRDERFLCIALPLSNQQLAEDDFILEQYVDERGDSSCQ